jgi:hypothetical protein
MLEVFIHLKELDGIIQWNTLLNNQYLLIIYKELKKLHAGCKRNK